MTSEFLRKEKAEALSISIPLGSFNLSGGVKVLVLFANAMSAQGWRVNVIAPDYGAISPFEIDANVNIIQLTTGCRWFPMFIRKLCYYSKLAILNYNMDICLANYYLTAICAVVSKYLHRSKIKILWYVQGFEARSHGLLGQTNALSGIIHYFAAKLSYHMPLPIFCVSNWVRKCIRRPDSIVIHPPVLNPSVFYKRGDKTKDNSKIVIGTIGRQSQTKGYSYFLKAIELLPERSKVKVIVVSPQKNEVPLPSRISSEMIEATNETVMAAFYNRCDMFILSSLAEGFPLPPLEAMACGCAVVTTACGGVEDYAKDGVNCIVVPPADSKALALAIWKLYQDTTLRRRLTEGGFRTTQYFEKNNMVSEFIKNVREQILI